MPSTPAQTCNEDDDNGNNNSNNNNIIITRLPSNLRPTTCEWVHLVICGHFWSHHSIRHSQNAHDIRKPHLSTFYRTRVMANVSFTLRE